MLKHKDTKKGTIILARVIDLDYYKELELVLYNSSREEFI